MNATAAWLTGFAFGVLVGIAVLTIIFVWVAIKAVTRDARARRAVTSATLRDAIEKQRGGMSGA